MCHVLSRLMCLFSVAPAPTIPSAPVASASDAAEGVHQVPDGHWQASGHASHQGAEDAAAHLRAVAAQPQTARPCLATHRRLRPPCGPRAPHTGCGAQLQGQGIHTQNVTWHNPNLALRSLKQYIRKSICL